MTILGIDPGFGICGFAVLCANTKREIKLKTFGVIKTKSNSYFPDRLVEIADDFKKLLDKHQPDIVSIEDLFFVQNVTTGIKVAQVRGALIYLAREYGAEIVEPKPVEVKSVFTGNGKATKTDMKTMAQKLFGLKKSPQIDDSADAIGVAYYASQAH